MKITYRFRIYPTASSEPFVDTVVAESNEDAHLQMRERHPNVCKVQECFLINMFNQVIVSRSAWVILIILSIAAYTSAQSPASRKDVGCCIEVCQSLANKTGAETLYDAISTEQGYLPLGILSMKKFHELATEYGDYIDAPYFNTANNAVNNNYILHKEECISIEKTVTKPNSVEVEPLRERPYRFHGELVPKALFSTLRDSNPKVVLSVIEKDTSSPAYFKPSVLCQYKYDLQENTKRYAVRGQETTEQDYTRFRDSISTVFELGTVLIDDSRGYNRIDSITGLGNKDKETQDKEVMSWWYKVFSLLFKL